MAFIQSRRFPSVQKSLIITFYTTKKRKEKENLKMLAFTE